MDFEFTFYQHRRFKKRNDCQPSTRRHSPTKPVYPPTNLRAKVQDHHVQGGSAGPKPDPAAALNCRKHWSVCIVPSYHRYCFHVGHLLLVCLPTKMCSTLSVKTNLPVEPINQSNLCTPVPQASPSPLAQCDRSPRSPFQSGPLHSSPLATPTTSSPQSSPCSATASPIGRPPSYHNGHHRPPPTPLKSPLQSKIQWVDSTQTSLCACICVQKKFKKAN